MAQSNDESLGLDWIASNDVGVASGGGGGGGGGRSKRAAGHGHDAIDVTMTEVASQSHGVSSVDIGDSFTYEIVIDLSGIAVGDKADLVIEIFAMDQNNGEAKGEQKYCTKKRQSILFILAAITGFHLCQVHESKTRGPNVQTIQTNPIFTDYYKADYPTVVRADYDGRGWFGSLIF